MVLEAGDRIPADARLIEAHSLKCDEAPLTGESFPVEQGREVAGHERAVGDRRNMVFTGTTVTYGRARAIVTGTGHGHRVRQDRRAGVRCRHGKVARWRGEPRKSAAGWGLSRWASANAIVVSIARAWMGGQLDVGLLLTMTMFAIALAVAAVPEALAAIVTGALAVGMHEMAKRNALVRRMPAVETLGCTTVICTDKTGTLTKGEMTVRRSVRRRQYASR